MSQLFPIIKVDGTHLTTSQSPIASSTLKNLTNTLSPSLSIVGLLTNRQTTQQQHAKLKNVLQIKDGFVDVNSEAIRSRLGIQPATNFTIIKLQCSVDLCLRYDQSQNISKVIQRNVDQNRQAALLMLDNRLYKAKDKAKLTEYVNNGIIQGHLVVAPLHNRQYLNKTKTLKYVGNVEITILIHQNKLEASHVVDSSIKQLSKVLKTLAKNNLTYRTTNIRNGILIEENYSDRREEKVQKVVEQIKVQDQGKAKQPIVLIACFVVFLGVYLAVKFM